MNIIAAISFIVILAITLNISSTNMAWNCDYPLLSNYMYIILAFVATWLFSTALPTNVNMPMYIVSVIGIFILLFIIIAMPSKYFILKHVVWFLYLVAFTYIFIPVLQKSENMVNTVCITVGLFIVLSFIANMFMDKISLGWEKYMMMALIGLILIMVVSLFLPPSQNFIYTISYITIGLFSLFIFVDTKRLLMANCSNPDYINSSMSLFLDALNMFSAVNNLNQ
jgi:FtsH-binding integral membrane protein